MDIHKWIPKTQILNEGSYKFILVGLIPNDPMSISYHLPNPFNYSSSALAPTRYSNIC